MPFDLARISRGALTLLVIALEKDRDKLMFNNAAFTRCFNCITRLPSHCQRNPIGLSEGVKPASASRDMFHACCELVDHLSRELDKLPNKAGGWTGHTEFDHPAFLALSQTILVQAGVSRGVHAPFPIGLAKLANAIPSQLQCQFVTNYLGNLLQDYFDAAEIWRNIPNLPDDTPLKLRTEDARLLAELAFAQEPSGADPNLAEKIVPVLQSLCTEIFLEQDRRS